MEEGQLERRASGAPGGAEPAPPRRGSGASSGSSAPAGAPQGRGSVASDAGGGSARSPAKKSLRQRAVRSPSGELHHREGGAREVVAHTLAAQTLSEQAAALAAEAARELLQNSVSVFGLALFIFLYAYALLGVNLMSGPLALYLVLTVGGLTIFAMGLRTGLMPLGELVGARLPKKVSQPLVYLSIFVLGVLCTIAEPAIGALQKAGENTSEQKAPLLKTILSRSFVLSVMVGVGVGVAAVFGCVRLVLEKRLKPCLFMTCVPTMAVTLICVGIGGSFTTCTGLAWDCGAVTTGPVTVPIVLALGIGVAASSKTAATQASEGERTRMRRTSLLDTLDPVALEPSGSNQVCAAGGADDEEADLSGFGIVTFASLFPVFSVWALSFALGGNSVQPPPLGVAQPLSTTVDETTADLMFRRLHEEAHKESSVDVIEAIVGTTRAVVPLVGFLLLLQLGLVREPLPNPWGMTQGLCFCYVGMFVFTLGLNGALVPLGEGAGRALPEAIHRFGEALGPCVILLFGFLAGAMATFAEPALAALGETVEKLTKGSFKKYHLIGAVAMGVGSGIALGMAKVYFQLPLWVILVVGYGACLALTTVSEEAIACIAWDSAGVTTGPVTVPIVLASGLSLGKEVQAVEGFGILSCASIGPIMAVLVAGLLRGRGGPAAAAPPGVQEMAAVGDSGKAAAAHDQQ